MSATPLRIHQTRSRSNPGGMDVSKVLGTDVVPFHSRSWAAHWLSSCATSSGMRNTSDQRCLARCIARNQLLRLLLRCRIVGIAGTNRHVGQDRAGLDPLRAADANVANDRAGRMRFSGWSRRRGGLFLRNGPDSGRKQRKQGNRSGRASVSGEREGDQAHPLVSGSRRVPLHARKKGSEQVRPDEVVPGCQNEQPQHHRQP